MNDERLHLFIAVVVVGVVVVVVSFPFVGAKIFYCFGIRPQLLSMLSFDALSYWECELPFVLARIYALTNKLCVLCASVWLRKAMAMCTSHRMRQISQDKWTVARSDGGFSLLLTRTHRQTLILFGFYLGRVAMG